MGSTLEIGSLEPGKLADLVVLSRDILLDAERDHIGEAEVLLTMVGGRIGTLNELTIAIEERKPIGVLLGSGGMTDEVEHVLKAFGAAVVGVGHGGGCVALGVCAEQLQWGGHRGLGGQLLQLAQVVVVHGEHQVKREIGRAHV